jgi:DNA repair photolyase
MGMNFSISPRIKYVEGCQHQCRYCCFAKAQPQLRFDPLKIIDACRTLVKQKVESPVIVCADSDGYQSDNISLITRYMYELMHRLNLPFQIQTKAGTRAEIDFGVLKFYNGIFGQSISFSREESAAHWEPGAATLANREEALIRAKQMGITTYVSIMPVIEPEEALEVIRRHYRLVDHWDVTPYMPNQGKIKLRYSWQKFNADAARLFDKLGVTSYSVNAPRLLKRWVYDLGGGVYYLSQLPVEVRR